MQPPPVPGLVLRRVLWLARFDGLGVLWVATFFALTTAGIGDITGAGAWLILAGAGAIGLHGVGLLRGGQTRGVNWLVGSQLLFIAVVFVDCGVRLTHYDPTQLRAALTDEMKTTLVQAKFDPEDFLLLVWRTTYGLIALATLLYKGGLALYFHLRRPAVADALDAMELEVETPESE